MSMQEMDEETCDPETYLNIWLGIELAINFFAKIEFRKVYL